MNVCSAQYLKGLGEIAEAAYSIGASMQATVQGFRLTRANTPNSLLRADILRALEKKDCVAGPVLMAGAWGCGEDFNEGLHVITSV